MKRIVAGLIFCFLLIIVNTTHAAFSSSSVRLDRLKTGTALSGYVCATPSSAGAGTEAKVSITFPSSFSISTTPSNWSVSTGSLPGGSTAWPGIGSQAQSVVGQTVTFASSDLSSGSSLYCFRFTTTGSTSGTSTGNLVGTMTTKTSGNTTIDSQDFALAISSNDQITVSATVPAHPTDFEASLTKTTAGNTFSQGQTINYEFSYGSTLSYPSAITVQAEWSQGAGIYDTLEYVSGSATDAYNSTAPVIDTINRTITWTISSIPGNTTNQTVSFSLRTTSTYLGQNILDFSVSGRVLGPGTQTADSTITSYYQAVVTATPTPTPTPSSGGSSSSTTPTPTPTTTPSPLTIKSVDIQQIETSTAQIAVALSQLGKLSLSYGQQPTRLSQSYTSSQALFHLINLANLQAGTTYYFSFTATDSQGNKTTSDIYTFTTALPGEVPEPDITTLIISSNNLILDAPDSAKAASNSPVVIPSNTNYEFRIRIPNSELISRVQAIFRKKNVLGIRSFGKAEASTEGTELIEIENGVYSGRLLTPKEPGEYQLILRIYTERGSVVEKPVRDIIVTRPFTVIDSSTHRPIEDARVLLYKWNDKNRLYEKLTNAILKEGNPLFTDNEGILQIALPHGKYQASVTNLNYQDKTVDFVIGSIAGNYPQVSLDRAPLSLLTLPRLVRYGYRSFTEVFLRDTMIFIESLAISQRMFNLASFVILVSSSIIVTLSLKRRTSLAPREFLDYLLFHLRHLFSPKKHIQHISGTITDAQSDKMITGVSLYLVDVSTKEFVAQTTTKNGSFSFSQVPPGNYELRVMKFGYTSIIDHLNLSDSSELTKNYALIHHPHPSTVLKKAIHVLESLLNFSFETVLVVMAILGVALLYYGNWKEAWPFIVIALANLLLWIKHQRGH